MSRTIFITGGTRSGKSRFAEQLTLEFGDPLCYLATAQSLDNEMGERIKRHQQRRGNVWQTIEEPLRLTETLACCNGNFSAVLVDCLTLWLTNLLLLYEDLGEQAEERIMEDVHRLSATLHGMTTPVVLVSNEVGMGIVPEHYLGRVFRDIAGETNQIMAAASNEAWLVASGIPLKLK